MSLEHNNISFDKIEKYIAGDMTSVEKNTFEKEALENPFLQDAIDGYSENKDGLQHYKQNLKHKSNQKFTYILLGGLALVTLIASFWVFNRTENINTPVIIAQNNDSIQQEVEVLPIEFDTLHTIQDSEVIHQAELVEEFKNNPIFDKDNYLNKNEGNIENSDHKPDDFVKIEDMEDHEEEEEIITTTKRKKVYPFVYYYELAVVDYRSYEDRTTINKTKYVYSGLSADFESEEIKQDTELTEVQVAVSYMEYLEESMWYFSKEKYKNALKRFDVIAGQYKNDQNALFYGGLSNYNLGRFDFALKNFSTITSIGDSPFYADALWYKAKTEIKLGKNMAAKYDLEALIIESDFYSKKAILLLKEID